MVRPYDYDGTQNGGIPFESSTYGSKFVALHIAYEMLLAFRTSRMLGMSTNSPDDVFLTEGNPSVHSRSSLNTVYEYHLRSSGQ